MKEKISIIVPVYNVEKYVTECLESLKNQTYPDIEIIMIDDESTDRSGEICEEYARQDNRFKAHHVKNGGVSRARNYGMSVASGDWIMFLDSDDYLDLKAIEILHSAAEQQHADIVSCSYYCAYENWNKLVGMDDGKKDEQQLDPDSFIHDMIIYPDRATRAFPTCLVPWGKIIRKEILDHGLTFPLDLHPHEDALLNVEIIKQSEIHVYVHLPLIYYRQRNNASTRSKTKDNFLNNKVFLQYAAKIRNLKGNSIFSAEEYAVTCSKYYVYGMMNLWAYCGNKRKKVKEQLKKYLSDELYAEQLNLAKGIDLAPYGFSRRLQISIEAATCKNINRLALLSKLVVFREFVSGHNPIHKNKVFQ